MKSICDPQMDFFLFHTKLDTCESKLLLRIDGFLLVENNNYNIFAFLTG